MHSGMTPQWVGVGGIRKFTLIQLPRAKVYSSLTLGLKTGGIDGGRRPILFTPP